MSVLLSVHLVPKRCFVFFVLLLDIFFVCFLFDGAFHTAGGKRSLITLLRDLTPSRCGYLLRRMHNVERGVVDKDARTCVHELLVCGPVA